MKRAYLAALLTLGLAGCAEDLQSFGPSAQPPPPPPPPLVETGSIHGLAAFHTAAGYLGSCAGLSVLATAESPESRARMVSLYGSTTRAVQSVAAVRLKASRLPPPPPTAGAAQCDEAGRFSFNDLHAGAYFLIAHVHVRRGDRPDGDDVILQRVVLRPGETRDVAMAE